MFGGVAKAIVAILRVMLRLLPNVFLRKIRLVAQNFESMPLTAAMEQADDEVKEALSREVLL